MDRHGSWSGASGAGGIGRSGGTGRFGGQGRRVPPRAGQRTPPRRRQPRAATWDGARRWGWLALGALATWLLLLPRLAQAQGLRSRTAAVSLTVTAPPALRTTAADPGTVTVRRGPSVVDAGVALPAAPFALARVDVRVVAVATPAAQGMHLFVRDGTGALRQAGADWITVSTDSSAATRLPSATPTSASATVAAFRAVANGDAMEGHARWRVHLRLVPRERDMLPIVVTRDLVIATPR